MQTSQIVRCLGLALAAVGFAAGCSDDDPAPFDPTREAKFRIVNASPAAQGEADFLLDGARVARLGYALPTAYIDVTAGTRTLEMRDLPDQDGNPGQTFISTPVDIVAGRFESAIVTGSGADIAAIVTTDGATPPSGSWSLRVIHAGQSTTSLDLYVTAPGADLNAATPLVAGIDWKEATDYQVIGVATLQIRLTPTGTKTPVISSESIPFQDGQVSSLFVFDNPTPGNLPFGRLLADGGVLE